MKSDSLCVTEQARAQLEGRVEDATPHTSSSDSLCITKQCVCVCVCVWTDFLFITEQAARAQLEGRVEDAEALCQLAYESYRLNFCFWEFDSKSS